MLFRRLHAGRKGGNVTSAGRGMLFRRLHAGHKGGNVTSAGWQVTLCDPMWHVSSRSGVAGL